MTQPVLSASQLETFKLCERRWGFVYLDKLREPFAESAQAGTLVHDRIEKHLIGEKRVDAEEIWTAPSGKIYEIGKISLAMLENIPWGFGELTKDQVETKLTLSYEGIEYTGRVDLRVDCEDFVAKVEIWDQKTTSDLRYAKSEEVLDDDIQKLMYAQWGFSTSKADAIDMCWNYGTTKGAKPKTRKVQLRVLRDETRVKFEKIVQPLARRVLAAYAHGDKKRLRQNTDACSRFPPKGCPFKEDCVERKMNLLEKIKNKNSVVEPERAAIVAEHVKAIAAMQEAQSPQVRAEKLGVTPPSEWETGTKPFDPINSPEGQLRAQTQPPTTVPIVVDTLPKKPRKKREPEIELKTVPMIKVDAEHEKLVDSLVSEKIKALADENKPLGGFRADLSAAIPLTLNDDTQGKSPSNDTDKPIRTLFIGAIPLGKPVKFAHDLIAKAAQTVENDLELHHVLLAPYSTGGASLAAQLKTDILSSGESGFDLVLMNRTAEGRAIEATLCGLAENVVVGL